MLRGIQSKGVSACPKHFTVNSQETRRIASDSVVDERTLREIYLACFERVVKEAHPVCIMSSYNLVNGTYVNEDPYLLRQILRDEWGFDRCGPANAEKAADACQLASRADVVLLCLGLDETRETEGAERQDMCLAASQVALVSQLAAVNPNIVVLLSAGTPVETGWDKDVKALVHLCLGGQAGARAALDVVCGLVNPLGKLAETWSHALSDTATATSYPAEKKHALYKEALYVGCHIFDSAQANVAYPFGFGLSYTTFDYSDLQVDVQDGSDPQVKVSCAVANTGPAAGAEVVQLYVAKPEGDVFRPAQELRAFDEVAGTPQCNGTDRYGRLGSKMRREARFPWRGAGGRAPPGPQETPLLYGDLWQEV